MQNADFRQQNFPRLTNRWIVGSTVIAIVVTGAISFYAVRASNEPTPSIAGTAENSSTVKLVTALGRLEPEGETISLSISEASGTTRVAQLLVKQGDRITAGQVIAILDTRDRLTSALEKAKQQVKVAQARLAQVQAGAKSGEIAAQRATIARLEAELQAEVIAQAAAVEKAAAELRNAQAEYTRYQSIYTDGAVSTSIRDAKRLTLDTVEAQLNQTKANQNRTLSALREQLTEARATLDRIAEVRPVDVAAAQAEVDDAQAAVRQAEANLELAYVRSPINGQILKVHTKPGEVVSNASKGIVELGQTEQMYAVAEVYQSDIGKIRPGQTAILTSNAFAGELQGTVDRVGLQVAKQDVLGTDPAADQDARVIEVKIRLSPSASKQVSNLTNLQLKVSIHI